jgi:ABC-2 type transport system permease protein
MKNSLFATIRQRYRYSAILLRQLVITDFKLRYQGSVLGYVWSLLRPLLLFAILYVVFVHFLRFGESIPHFAIYLLTGVVLWTFFAEITNNSVTAIVDKGDIIRKVNFPKYIIVLAGAFSALINLILNFVVILVFVMASGIELRLDALLAPLYIIELFAFALALGFILGALFVRIRDLNYIWEVIMQAMFYATPIIYPLSMVSDRWPEVAQIMLLNPVAQTMQDIRYHLITDQTQTLGSLGGFPMVLIPFAIVAVVLLIAVIFFKQRSPYFAEEV